MGGGVYDVYRKPPGKPRETTLREPQKGATIPLQGVRGGLEIKSNNFIWTNHNIIKGLIKIIYVVVAPVWEVWPCSVLLAGRHEGS